MLKTLLLGHVAGIIEDPQLVRFAFSMVVACVGVGALFAFALRLTAIMFGNML